ncbi:MAG TPA: cupin domain-containing protein [bacterium]|nr:cupin domain-containing protein [bacterium]
MSTDAKYSIHTDVKFRPLERIDIRELAGTVHDKWFNQTLCQVNESVVRLGVIEGDFHWHKHDHEAEFFYVVDGTLVIDLEGRTVELGPQQGFVVPQGVSHRTRAPARSIILMVERGTVIPTGDASPRNTNSASGQGR